MTEVLIRSCRRQIGNRFLPQLVLRGSWDCSVVSHRDTEKKTQSGFKFKTSPTLGRAIFNNTKQTGWVGGSSESKKGKQNQLYTDCTWASWGARNVHRQLFFGFQPQLVLIASISFANKVSHSYLISKSLVPWYGQISMSGKSSSNIVLS